MSKELKQTIEKIFEKATWTIRKFANDEEYKNDKPYEISTIDGNSLVNEGINHFLTIIGTDSKTGTPFSASNAYLIVGTGTTAVAATDTEATFTSAVKKPMVSGYPTYGTNQKIVFKSSYGADDANQAWNEFGVVNAATGGKLFNRKVSNQGTKISGQVWELTLEITFS